VDLRRASPEVFTKMAVVSWWCFFVCVLPAIQGVHVFEDGTTGTGRHVPDLTPLLERGGLLNALITTSKEEHKKDASKWLYVKMPPKQEAHVPQSEVDTRDAVKLFRGAQMAGEIRGAEIPVVNYKTYDAKYTSLNDDGTKKLIQNCIDKYKTIVEGSFIVYDPDLSAQGTVTGYFPSTKKKVAATVDGTALLTPSDWILSWAQLNRMNQMGPQKRVGYINTHAKGGYLETDVTNLDAERAMLVFETIKWMYKEHSIKTGEDVNWNFISIGLPGVVGRGEKGLLLDLAWASGVEKFKPELGEYLEQQVSEFEQLTQRHFEGVMYVNLVRCDIKGKLLEDYHGLEGYQLEQKLHEGLDPYTLRDRNGDGEYLLRNLIRLVYRLGLLGFAHGELVGSIVVHRRHDRCHHWAVEPTLALNLEALQELRDTTLGQPFGKKASEYQWTEKFIDDVDTLYYYFYEHIVENGLKYNRMTGVRDTEVIKKYGPVWEKMSMHAQVDHFKSWPEAGENFKAIEFPYKYLVKDMQDELKKFLAAWQTAVSGVRGGTLDEITFETVLTIREAGLNLVKLLYEKTNWRVRGGDMDRLAPLPLRHLYSEVADDYQKAWTFGAAGTAYYSNENLWGDARHTCE